MDGPFRPFEDCTNVAQCCKAMSTRRKNSMFPFSFQIFDFYIESLLDPVPGAQWTFALYSSVNINITYSPHLVQGNADSKHMSTISFKVKSSKVSDLTLP